MPTAQQLYEVYLSRVRSPHISEARGRNWNELSLDRQLAWIDVAEYAEKCRTAESGLSTELKSQ